MTSPAPYLPSSPPLLPIPNPQIPSNLPEVLQGQKRFHEYDPSSDPASSDAPIFSSDDLPAKEVFENPYKAYRRVNNVKRQRSSSVLISHAVFMANRTNHNNNNGDNHEVEEDGLPSSSSRSKGTTHESFWSDEADEANTSMTTIRGFGSQTDVEEEDEVDGDILSKSLTLPFPPLDESEIHANLIIQKAIETGDPYIDLSDLGLNRIPTDITSLSSLILQTKLSDESLDFSRGISPGLLSNPNHPKTSSGIDTRPSEPYASLISELQIYLTQNNIQNLSNHLFKLSNITLLALRGNPIRSIPSYISKLKSLKTLSLAWNQISYFPFSILSLKEFDSTNGILYFPNPLFTFPGLRDGQYVYPTQKNSSNLPYRDNPVQTTISTLESELKSSAFVHTLQPDSQKCYKFIISTPISLFDELGHLITPPLHPELPYPSKWNSLKIIDQLTLPVLNEPIPSPPKKCIRKFPSLLESCLRTISNSNLYSSLSEVQKDEILETIPDHLSNNVKKAMEGEEWKDICSVCGNHYVMKGGEWIEWWEFRLSNPRESHIIFTPKDINTIYSLLDSTPENSLHLTTQAINQMSYKGSVFFRDFTGRYLNSSSYYSSHGQVLPLLRKVCSWDCADEWQRERWRSWPGEGWKEDEGRVEGGLRMVRKRKIDS